MNFNRSIRKSFNKPIKSELDELYPRDLQFYTEPPVCEITYAEFEDCAAERLKALQAIDDVNARGLKGEEWRKTIMEELKKLDMRGFCKLFTSTGLGSVEEDCIMRRRDHISQYILRLAYCETEEKRRWFMARELDLFRFRWMYLSQQAKQEFLKVNNLSYEVLSDAERNELCELSLGMIMPSIEYYKVPFVLVSDLVRTRKVYLRRGFAFITSDDLISVIVTSYRSELAQSLAFASRRVHMLDEDDRIFMVLKGAGQSQRDCEYSLSANKEKINIQNLDAMSEMSYPLCMQQLHKTLRVDHHLRHSGRQQYGLFLKGIGVTLEDALRFWRLEFTRKMDAEKFEKSYSYNIRHNYGKEGKRANYAPHSCMKVITGSVGPGEQHGCPFKHSDPVTLKNSLQKNGLSVIGTQEVLELTKKGHFQLACSKYFQLKHGISEPVIISHPNLYFDLSLKVLGGKSVKKEDPGAPKAGPSNFNKTQEMWGDDSGFDFSAVEEMS